MQMTSLGFPDFRSGVLTSLRGSLDFFSRYPDGGGPLEDTTEDRGTGHNVVHMDTGKSFQHSTFGPQM